MKATILLAVLMANFTAIYADCNKACVKIDINDSNNPCGYVNQHSGQRGCQCVNLGRARSNDLYLHQTNTKVEIYDDNAIHMFCYNSDCYRDYYCRIDISYRDAGDKGNDGNYELPAYNDCCKFPGGYIDSATMYDIGY